MTTTATPATRTVKHPTRTKVYKALFASIGDRDKALAAYHALSAPLVTPAETTPVAVEKPKKKGKKGKKVKKVKKLSAQDTLEALVATRGFTFTRGRVYVTPEIVEACVRVLKTGRTEVATTSGKGRVDAVAVFATESGDVAVQNLVRS